MIVHGEGSRYVVSETKGYPIRIPAQRGGGAPFTEFVVLDSDYAYRPAWRPVNVWPTSLIRRRAATFALCDRLNREHEEAMRA